MNMGRKAKGGAPARAGRRPAGQARRRIIEAVVALHEEVGPAATTISAVAERAGVQRLTVYRHFPDEGALIGACSQHWAAAHPLPDASQWPGIADPEQRARAALTSLYGYYERGQRMLAQVLRDEGRVPVLAQVMTAYHAYHRELAATIAAGWGVSGERQRAVRAFAGHAAQFRSWRTLTMHGLSSTAAAELMAECLAAAARGAAPPGAAMRE